MLCQKFGDDWHTKVKAFFAGDDTTDEDAMRVSTRTVIICWLI